MKIEMAADHGDSKCVASVDTCGCVDSATDILRLTMGLMVVHGFTIQTVEDAITELADEISRGKKDS